MTPAEADTSLAEVSALAVVSVDAEGPFAKVDALVTASAEVMGSLPNIRAHEPEATWVSSQSTISVNSLEEECTLLLDVRI